MILMFREIVLATIHGEELDATEPDVAFGWG
ncbi:MAG: hypothetical protein M2R45_04773 [Verrucomicrobia subdivision 3 bacterium]|nr:hypothetical protein [Limisphaerales bacterium]MCS1415103.1 hypothetical protein [Limisphaerales bacterium]